MEQQKEKKGFFSQKVSLGWISIISAVVVIIVLLIIGSISSKSTIKDGIITERNTTITDIKTERDALQERIKTDSLDVLQKKDDRDAMADRRRTFLSETGLDDFKFTGIYWKWNSNPDKIEKGIKKVDLNYSPGQTVMYADDIVWKLDGIFAGDKWSMQNTLRDLFKVFPSLFEGMYNINHDIIKSLKTKWELKDQGKQLIPYLDGTQFPYEKDFEKYYQFHTLNDSSVYGSQKYGDFEKYCIKTYPDYFSSNKEEDYTAENVVYTTYGLWRSVRANLNEESKRVLLNILRDYNTKNKKEQKEKEQSLSDFF